MATSRISPTAASGTNWTNPTNVFASDDLRASYANSGQNGLFITGFGFFDFPPAATITGVRVFVQGHGTSSTAANRSIEVGMTKDGTTLSGSWLAAQNLPQTTDATLTFGSSTNLFGTTLSPSDLNASTWGIVVRAGNTNTSERRIDHVDVDVFYTLPKTEDFYDRFTGTVINQAKWTGVTALATTQNNGLQITTGDTFPFFDDPEGAVTSASLVGSYAFCEIDMGTFQNVPVNIHNVEFTLYRFSTGNDMLRWEINFSNESGSAVYTLNAKRYITGTVTTIYTATYNALTHRWLRFRESGGTVHWESSADGHTWVSRYSESSPFAVTDMIPAFYAESYEVQTVTIDNFNVFPPQAQANGTASLTATAHVTHYPSITFAGSAEVSAQATNLEDQGQVTKTYLYKVYDADDNFLGVWKDVISEFTYSQEINSAGSAIQVELARNSDSRIISLESLITTQASEDITTQDGNVLVLASETDNNIGPGSDVDVNYRVEVWVFFGQITELSTTSGELILTQSGESIMVNDGAVNGRRKFNGYITRYISRYGSTETVQVSIASFGVELDNYVLESGGDTTVAFNSYDPGEIVRDGLDLFNADGGIVTYSTSTVSLTGTTVSYTFRVNTYLELIKKAVELAPYDWYWYVGLGDDLVYFKAKPATPSHYFILGKHIESLNLEYSIEDITNLVYFTGAETAGVNLFKKYEDATSITNYRQGLQRISDLRVSVPESADIISEAEIDRNSEPRYRSSITILDEAYQIEEITLGQKIGFRNFGNYIDDLEMQIVGIDYEPDRVTLQLDTLLPSVNKRIEDITRNLNELQNENVPDTPS